MIELAVALIIQANYLKPMMVPCFPATVVEREMTQHGFHLDEIGVHRGGKHIVQVWRNDEGTAMIGALRPDGQYCSIFTIDGGLERVEQGDPA